MLNVPYQKQQSRRWCGPATLAMVLAYYGLDIDQRDIASEVIRSGRSFADDLGRYATMYGFEVLRIHGIEDQPAIHKLSELINSGIPPIVVQHPVAGDDEGHFRIVIDVTRRFVVVHDSHYGSRRRYLKQEFLQLWKAHGSAIIEDDNTIVVIRRPRIDVAIDSCPYCGDIPLNHPVTCKDCQQTFIFPRGFPTECSCCHAQWTQITCGKCNRLWIYFKPIKT